MSVTVMNKLSAERNQRLLVELVTKPGNDICADCKARNPRWASFNLGIFICVSCASIHRKIGTHITKVKSLNLDSWTKEQVDRMKEMGNAKSNAIYNLNEVRNPPPPRLDDPARDNDMEQYIRSKYEYKRFVSKNVLVASKLGPSRSASALTPQTNAIPTHPPQKPASTPPQPKTATDIAATMFSTTKPQLQPRATDTAPIQATARSPVRSASHPIVSQNNSKSPTTAAKPEGVWADLISLQEPASNASLPLQYQAANLNYTGIPSSNTMPASLSGMGTNPFSGMTRLSSTGSTVGPFHQPSFNTNPFGHQQSFSSQPSFPTSTSTPSFQPNPSPQIPSNFNPSNSPMFQAQPQLQISPNVPFYQPQPQQSSLAPLHSQSQFLSSSPNPHFLSSNSNTQFMSSHSPQLLSTTPTSQQNSSLQTGFNANAGNGIGMGVPGYLSPSPQPGMMNGQSQVMQQQPNQMFGGGLAQPQHAQMMGNNPFGQRHFGQEGFAGQAGAQWGPL